jgi:uncharacterized protein (TIGR02271 family)
MFGKDDKRTVDETFAHDPEDWGAASGRYRSQWDQRYGATGPFEEHEADYRYIHDLSSRPEYRGRQWADVESELRSGWQTQYPDQPWEAHQEHMRGAWDDNAQTLQLREEELVAQKRERETGRVSVGKDVVTERREMDVPVTREEVYIERRPVDRRPTDQPIGADAEHMEVVTHEEQVEVQKRPVVYEEVAVGKRTTQETRQVEADVRREVAEVHHDGDVDVQGDESLRTDR